MTNSEYEAACVTAAKVYDRFEGEHKLKQQDAIIAQTEATLARLQEQRREIVNQYNLNKTFDCCNPTAAELELLRNGDFCAEELWGGSRPTCPKCVGKIL